MPTLCDSDAVQPLSSNGECRAARRRGESLFVVAAFAFMSFAFALDATSHVAKGQTPSDSASRPVPPNPTLKKRVKSKTTIGRGEAAPAAPEAEPPVFLSKEWIKKDQETEDRLRRTMNICKGC